MTTHGATLCLVPEVSAAEWALVGLFVENESGRKGLNQEQLAQRAKMSRATLNRLKTGKSIGPASLAQIEGALGLARDLLPYIAHRDLAAVEEATGDADLVRWLTRKYADLDSAQDAPLPLDRISRRSARALGAVVENDLPAAARRGRKSQVENPEPHAE